MVKHYTLALLVLALLNDTLNVSVQVASVPRRIGSSRGHDRLFSRGPIPVSSAGGRCEPFWHGQGCPLYDVCLAFPIPTTASPTLQGALKDGFGEVVEACDMPNPSKFSSLDGSQKRFLWAHKEVDLAPQPAVSLVFQVGDAQKFSQALNFESLDAFPRVSKQGPRLTAKEEDGGDRVFYNLYSLVSCWLVGNLRYC